MTTNTRARRLSALGAAAAAAFISLAGPAALASSRRPSGAKRPFSIEDLYRVQAPSGAQVSPDGAWVVYALEVKDLGRGKSNKDLARPGRRRRNAPADLDRRRLRVGAGLVARRQDDRVRRQARQRCAAGLAAAGGRRRGARPDRHRGRRRRAGLVAGRQVHRLHERGLAAVRRRRGLQEEAGRDAGEEPPRRLCGRRTALPPLERLEPRQGVARAVGRGGDQEGRRPLAGGSARRRSSRSAAATSTPAVRPAGVRPPPAPPLAVWPFAVRPLVAQPPGVQPPAALPRPAPPRPAPPLAVRSAGVRPPTALPLAVRTPDVRPPAAPPRRAPLPDGRRPVLPLPAAPPAVVPPRWKVRAWPAQRLARAAPGQLAPARHRRHREPVASHSRGSRRRSPPRCRAPASVERRTRPASPRRTAPRRSRPARGLAGALCHRGDWRAMAFAPGPHPSRCLSFDRPPARSLLPFAPGSAQGAWMAQSPTRRHHAARSMPSSTARRSG